MNTKQRAWVAAVAAVTVLVCGAGESSAQESVRAVIQLRADAELEPYARDFAPDARNSNADGSTYHRRQVVGAAQSLEKKYGFRATNFYSHAIRGFAATLRPSQLRKLASDPLVESAEIENVISLDPLLPAADPGQVVAWGIPKIGADISTAQSGNGSGTVTGVTLYVVDTGIDATHPDLNVVGHMSFLSGPDTDCHGHGTAVSGIAAARDDSSYVVGVAPGAPLVGIKVMTCDGLTLPSVIVQALDWLTANAVKPAVVNLSLGSAIPLTATNAAARGAAESGLVLAIAAGNGNPFTGAPMNACVTSPASAGYFYGIPNGVITAAATDENDEEASFSNFGVCIDVWAPGVTLTSTWLMSTGGLTTASGTSFSSPYVAGAAALLLSRFPTLTPPLVEYIIQQTAAATGTLSRDGRPIRRLSIGYF